MSLLRGVGARLSLALALVVAVALGIVYLIVVPSLEGRLVDSKTETLRAALPGVIAALPADPFRWPDYVDLTSFRVNARIVVYDVDSISPTAVRVVADSRAATSEDVSDDQLVLRAIETNTLLAAAVGHIGTRFAEAAAPAVSRQYAVMLQVSLAESISNIRLVERRLVLAGLIALAVALLIGLGGASAFARRIRRLERAANRIAHGRFDEPVRDRGADELGQLAVAFDRMRERLQGLDGARREFIANASHELRTPIFALSGGLELLAEEEMDDATRQEFIASMREQTERLTKLAEELLDLSRLDAGRLRVDRVPVELGRVAAEVVEEFAAAARLSGHLLGAETGLGEPTVALGDGERVHQIARGLAENALRHTPSGTTVRVGARRSGSVMRLTVADDGPGIAAEYRERVFERFFRVDGGRASGSGLGLAIAAELAERMGGSLELAVADGWTRFTLTLPAAADGVLDGPE